MNAVFGITGWKNSGKTTLVAALVAEFTRRGLRVSTVKHAHDSFSVDHKGTDSFAHTQAGAMEVALVSRKRWALMHELQDGTEKPTLETMLSKLAPCDLVLVEGFKASAIPKIECIRSATAKDEPIWQDNDSIVALASDGPVDAGVLAVLDLNSVPEIADYIIQKIGLHL